MNDLQKIQFEALKKIIEVCDKHHLTYYLFGGSCLGAIRHQGFIPWDDDIDIAMPRPDFDKLMALKNEFGYPYFLQNMHTDRKYALTFAKLKHSKTAQIETVFQTTKMHHGIWVDIFPLDGMATKLPKNNRPFKSWKAGWLWFRWFFSYVPNAMSIPKFNKSFFMSLGINLLGLFLWPLNLFNWNSKSIEKSCKKIKYEDAVLVGPFMTVYLSRDVFPKDYFGEGVEGTFEGMKVRLPSKHHEYLTQIYGDYMKPPPKKRQTGHLLVGTSTTESYIDLLEEENIEA